MPRVITTLQAMSHPTVVETINCLSEMSQRLQDENDELRAALAQPEQEPWATREDFYLELDRRVERIREEMEIKTVSMRCKDYDIALQIIDMHFGHVIVGQVSTTPKRPWVGLTDEEYQEVLIEHDGGGLILFYHLIEARLREKNST